MKTLFFSCIIALAIPLQGQDLNDTAITQGGRAVTERQADSMTAGMSPGKTQSPQTQKIKIIKKEVDYSVFVKLAIGMMCFIALFYASSQTWNPG
jgi:hypothetical protein